MRPTIRRNLATLGVGAVLAGGCVTTPPPPTSSSPAPTTRSRTAPEISEALLRRAVETLAHDSMRGREAGTAGGAAAAKYLAAEAARLGLRPAGDDGGYFNAVPLLRRRAVASAQIATRGITVQPTLDELFPVSGVGGLPRTGRQEGEGPIVYAGYLLDPAVRDELGAEQIRGAVVMLHLGAPAGVERGAASPRLPLTTLFSPQSPAAAVIIVQDEAEPDFWEYAHSVAARGQLELNGASAPGSAPPFFMISRALAERVLGAPLKDSRAPRREVGRFRFSLAETLEPQQAWNVVAALPGSDSARAAEYVALGAHYDHVGVGQPVNGDSIYNGADDDASGSAALLGVAAHFASRPAAQRPARSLLFVWHTAEEAGLLGSESFTERPPVPRANIVAQLNVDMVARNSPDSIFVVGSRRLSTQLGDLVTSVNARRARPFQLDYSYDPVGHPEQLYCRSDHYNYARFGIPIAFFTTGLHPDYHKPSDEADKLDYDKLARVSGLLADLAGEVANLATRPRVDRPGGPDPNCR